MRKPLWIFVLLFPFTFYSARGQQVNPNEYVETPPELLRNEISFGVNIHSHGWGLDFRRGKNLSVWKKRMLEFEFVGMHHSKETKSVNPYYDNSKSYTYGKLNSVSILRSAIGFQRVIASKAEKGGVELRVNYTGGFAAGFAKPVYLNIIEEDLSNPGLLVISTEKYDPLVHFPEYIYGKAAFTRGFSEIKFYPGVYGKLGISFEYGAYDDDVKIIEAGITVDAFPSRIPIMAFTDNSRIYLNFYINLIYGRKW